MVDTDQGGVWRQLHRVTLGPSVGEIQGPDQVILRVTTANAVIPIGYTLVLVSVPGPASLTLPPAASSVPTVTQAIPLIPITIQDETGNANGTTNRIRIFPSGADNISGLTFISISSPYGSVVLTPDPVNGNWRVGQ